VFRSRIAGHLGNLVPRRLPALTAQRMTAPVERDRRVGLSPTGKVRFALDSPLEGDGFEPSVPRSRERTSDAKSDLQEDNRRRSIRQAE
jgi:hypothetical protein